MVEVTFRQLDKLNFLLDGVLKVGFNEICFVLLGVVQLDVYKDKVCKVVIDNVIYQVQELVNGFYCKLGLVYSVCYYVFNYQFSLMVWMMKVDVVLVFVQEIYEQVVIQFDDQVDVVFQLEFVD